MTALDGIVARFRSGSPNIAAAFDEVQRRLLALEIPTVVLPPPVVAPPPPPPVEGDRVSVRDRFGGDIRAALLSGEKRLYVAPGSYTHSDLLPHTSKDVLYDNVTLTGVNGTKTALILSGVGTVATFKGVCRIVRPGPAQRVAYVEGAGIAVGAYNAPRSSNIRLHADDLTLENPWQIGVFVHDTSGAVISGKVLCRGSGADTFHTTGGATDVDWQAALIAENSGDDGAAVVSYGANPICERVRYRNVVVRGAQKWGRGVTLVGGKACTVDFADISDTAGAGVYVAVEPEYVTHGVDGWRVLSAKVRRPNRKNIHPANVIVYSNRPGIMLANVDITVDADPLFPLVKRTGVGAVSNVRVNGQAVV